VQECPIVAHTSLAHIPPNEVQQAVNTFLRDGVANDRTSTRAFACMECFKCVEDVCPVGLNPLRVNQIIKWVYRMAGGLGRDMICHNHASPDSRQRQRARLHTTAEEFARISTASNKSQATYVFFPGCNVYGQPDKILQALDILDLITDDYAFVPGLDNCCGDAQLTGGNVEQAEMIVRNLLHTLAAYQPEKVILWCPTCHCRFAETYAPVLDVPFALQSFPQFLAEHMSLLPLREDMPPRTVTLHEPCKSAYMGTDTTGPRDLLRQLPGVTLVEMVRHGKDTSCCGSNAVEHFPQSFAAVRDERLKEAAETQADILVDVCHFCHETFVSMETSYEYRVVNYVTLVAEALGIAREEYVRKHV
jgi:Fe-S oxidoreductase